MTNPLYSQKNIYNKECITCASLFLK